MKYVSIYCLIGSFALSTMLFPKLIPFLQRLKFGQNIREELPEEHLKKAGTPSMGALGYLFGITVVGLIAAPWFPHVLPVLFVTLGFGLIGFLDDYAKIVKKQSEGLNPKQKLIGQLVISAIFCAYLMLDPTVATTIRIPFTGGYQLNIGWLFIPFYFVVALGTDNGVNLTDGLDGLSGSVTTVVALFLTVASLRLNAGIEPVCAAVAGGLLSYLMFNVYPAKVFMGDTGSLALGGFVLSSMFMMQMPLYILLAGFIYLAESISVILQVAYFKKTGGKRLFRMAPIHHHFELCGWSEPRIVNIFSTVALLLCLVAYLAI